MALNGGEHYPPEAIAEAFLAVHGTRLLSRGGREWTGWRARWEWGGRHIEVDLMACDVDPEDFAGQSLLWGGSGLLTHCLLPDLLTFWQAVRSRCPAVWLHDSDTFVWSPESFAREVAAFRARTPGPQWRPGWGEL